LLHLNPLKSGITHSDCIIAEVEHQGFVLVHMISDTLPPFFFADIVQGIAVV
jgi:hypothetical protein